MDRKDPKLKVPLPESKCLECQKPIKPYRSNHQFCCTLHRVLYWQKGKQDDLPQIAPLDISGLVQHWLENPYESV
jgi:hypothetical protein